MLRKIYYIAKREFEIRIRKKSFWIMTFMGPIIMALLMIVPVWFTLDKSDAKAIVATNLRLELFQALPAIEGVHYIANNQLNDKPDSVLKWLNADMEVRQIGGVITIHSTKVNVEKEQLILKSLENKLLKMNSKTTLNTEFKVNYLPNLQSGRAVQELLGYAMGIGVYFFIFMYGIQVMKGVVEEKTNRIIEVMLCTVKPFELMMGKIFGISLVGFCQFLIWIFSVLGLQALIKNTLQLDKVQGIDLNTVSNGVNLEVLQGAQAYLNVLETMNLPIILIGFLWFFLFGFLLYAALFAVVGSASDVDTDTQQFIFPITVPLLGTIILAQQIIASPHAQSAKILSFFPFTSLLAMPMRLPFEGEEPYFGMQLVASGLLLFVTFVGVVWVAARIYRIGILTYGSKVGYKQLVKWFFEKE